jgi:hypothetical protein
MGNGYIILLKTLNQVESKRAHNKGIENLNDARETSNNDRESLVGVMETLVGVRETLNDDREASNVVRETPVGVRETLVGVTEINTCRGRPHMRWTNLTTYCLFALLPFLIQHKCATQGTMP